MKIYPVIRDLVPHVVVDAHEELLIPVHPLSVVFFGFAGVKLFVLRIELSPQRFVFRVAVHVEALFDSGERGMLVVVRILWNYFAVISARHESKGKGIVIPPFSARFRVSRIAVIDGDLDAVEGRGRGAHGSIRSILVRAGSNKPLKVSVGAGAGEYEHKGSMAF